MIPLSVIPDIDQAGGLPHVERDKLITETSAAVRSIGLLRHGTSEGRASVGLLIELPDGRQVIAETSWRLLSTAVRAMAAGPVGSEEVLD